LTAPKKGGNPVPSTLPSDKYKDKAKKKKK
jgi:hypothetical protein